jgi:hypothetical protein
MKNENKFQGVKPFKMFLKIQFELNLVKKNLKHMNVRFFEISTF